MEYFMLAISALILMGILAAVLFSRQVLVKILECLKNIEKKQNS